MAPDRPGGSTRHMPGGAPMSIFEAAQCYREEGVPLVIIAGRGYGTGSSRDWSAKGLRLLGVRAVIAESFERIHRANLVAAGVLPLQFAATHTRQSLKLDGSEVFDIGGLETALKPKAGLRCQLTRTDGRRDECALVAQLETTQEVEYFRHGGILNYVLRRICAA
jgi:aconitate hydratase